MKTRKTQLLFVALFSIILFAGNVSAEGTERRTASSLEIINEPALEIEAWMLNNYNFNAYKAEEALNLESWMMNENVSFFNEETDGSLGIESWMLNDRDYNFTGSFVNDVEDELRIESWMTYEPTRSTLETEKSLKIESWMLNTKI
ncbi:MAG: hypothetical protein JXR31_01350 [Prolixibacteraceae bacterium]|nr:hypothetical protein [Prolixibacteraceae bacterium]